MTKAIFFDIDGTLVSFNTHRISPGVLDGLGRLREKGVKLFIATGRQRGDLGQVSHACPFDGFITHNGQYCFAGDKVLRSNPISPAAAEQLLDLLEDTGLPCTIVEEHDTYAINRDARMDLYRDQLALPIPPSAPLDRARGRTIYQAVAFFTKEDELAAGERFFPGLIPLRWHPAFVDVIAPGGGKDQGMDAILDHFGFDLSQSMAFGDGENDLPMLRHAHIGVAMGNAGSYVKSQADYVTGTVDEDGILTALEHFEIL